MELSWSRILPVALSILVIILVAVIRQYSRTIAAITATMPINVPLALWIVYSTADNKKLETAQFSQGLVFGIIPTVAFIIVAWLAARAGWKIGPILAVSYLTWGVLLGLSFGLKKSLGIG